MNSVEILKLKSPEVKEREKELLYEISKLKRIVNHQKTLIKKLKYYNTVEHKREKEVAMATMSPAQKIKTLEQIAMEAKNMIEDFYNVTIDVKSRIQETVKARQLYYYFLLENTAMSQNAISKTLELNQDHSTIIHARQAIRNTIDQDHQMKSLYQNLLTI